MAGTVWDDVLGRIETKVNRYSYFTWFRPTSFIADTGNTIQVKVADPMVVDWLSKHYAGVLQEALAEVGRPGAQLEFIDESATPAPAAVPEIPEPAGDEPAPVPAAIDLAGLSPRYSFDTFIVGASNQFAHAACRAVAEAPSRSYNPLFLYGGVGLGKTHLMHAIGHYVLTHSPGLKLTYISAERFMNEVINAIRYDRILEFRERYRGVDVLLVDDIQFIVGKERTQTEFFHTFNALHDAQKQIVVTSDALPKEIPTLEERLRSRFEWGLIADIQPPDLEMKVAIIRKKAEAETVAVPNDVALFIAGTVKSNIRELEGRLNRVIAFSSLTGKPLSVELARETLRDIVGTEESRASPAEILKVVAAHYGLRVSDMKARSNSKPIAFPRQVAMYLCRRLTPLSYPEIGRLFNDKHHSTVMHSVEKIERLIEDDHDFRKVIESFLQRHR
jgi:chromosomal replication initiator protein